MDLLKAGNPGKFVQAEVGGDVDATAWKNCFGLGFKFELGESPTLLLLTTPGESGNGFTYRLSL